jgi:hypothetical protein
MVVCWYASCQSSSGSTDSITSFSSTRTPQSIQPPSPQRLVIVPHRISRLTAWPAAWRNPAKAMNPHEDAIAARLWHPWLRIDRATRAILAERLTHGPSERTDRRLAAIIAERQRIERAGWFN